MVCSRSLIAAALALACTHAHRAPPPPPEIRPRPALYASAAAQPIELVESWPLQTPLDHSDLRDAKDVWLELVESSKERLDFAEFYASDDPKGPSALTRVVEAVERALSRGVKVRWLGEETFYRTYPELMDRFARAGAQVRRLDTRRSMGGVLHAKYFLADRQAYLGSQNFDWRSLEHIQELGVRTATPEVVRALSEVFEFDWALAGGADPRRAQPSGPTGFPVETGLGQVTLVASPRGWLPDERLWDLPALVQLIDSAKRSVRVQLLTYRARGRGGDLPELDGALRRAAARGAKVELLVSDWSKRSGTIDGLKALHAPPSLTVKLFTVPQHPAGFIPFSRVAHAKYLVIDGARAWVGTSNWERDYFHASRNVGLIVEGGPLPERLDAFFRENWSAPYAEVLDPERQYEPPRIGHGHAATVQGYLAEGEGKREERRSRFSAERASRDGLAAARSIPRKPSPSASSPMSARASRSSSSSRPSKRSRG